MEWVKSITDKRMGVGKEEENKRRCTGEQTRSKR
nr:MAG TPA: hypothetical protein [Caudoviricetes sp.]